MPTLPIGSHTMYYDEYGAGQPIVLIPGLGASRLGWWKQIEPLAKKYRVINMDNRDAGDSAVGTTPYTIFDLADDIAALVQHLGAGAAHIVGISMGGFISIQFALHHPHLVKKLILVATSAGGRTHIAAAPEILALLNRDPNEDIETRTRRTFSMITGPGYMQAHPEDLDRIVQNAKRKPIALESYQRQLGAVTSHIMSDAATRLGEIRAPTLVAHGDKDPLIPYPNGKFLGANIPGARFLTYPNVGHLPTIEAADKFNKEVLEFLA